MKKYIANRIRAGEQWMAVRDNAKVLLQSLEAIDKDDDSLAPGWFLGPVDEIIAFAKKKIEECKS